MPGILIQKQIKIKEKQVLGIELKLPNANWVLAAAEKGFISCGYLDLTTAEKLSDAACLVRSVSTVEDLLQAKISGTTSFAKKLGIKPGMTGREALELLV